MDMAILGIDLGKTLGVHNAFHSQLKRSTS
jgi:hypothetical protein